MKTFCVLWLLILCAGCGYNSPRTMAPQPGVVPVVMQLSPSSAKAGGPGFTLTVNGSSFASNAVVNWNGTQEPTMFISPNQLTAAIPSAAIANAGTVLVSVTNPGRPGTGGAYGGGGTMSETSGTLMFSVN